MLFFVRFSSIPQHCSPFFFMHLLIHFLEFLTSFRLESVLSQFSSFFAQIKNFCSDSWFFLPTMFVKALTGCYSHYCAEGGDHWIHVSISIVHDGERYKLPAYHRLEGFRHTGIFQLFEVKRVLCVFACWFFSDEGGRSSSACRVHFQCLLLVNFVFWHCSFLTGQMDNTTTRLITF